MLIRMSIWYQLRYAEQMWFLLVLTGKRMDGHMEGNIRDSTAKEGIWNGAVVQHIILLLRKVPGRRAVWTDNASVPVRLLVFLLPASWGGWRAWSGARTCLYFTQDFFLQGQSAEKKTDVSTAETEPFSELHAEQTDTATKMPASSTEGVGVRQEQPFIVLSQEEYGEHHSSIMYCR